MTNLWSGEIIIGPLRFQAECRKRRLKLALVFGVCVIVCAFWYFVCLGTFELLLFYVVSTSAIDCLWRPSRCRYVSRETLCNWSLTHCIALFMASTNTVCLANLRLTKIIEQNWNQFLLVVKATALKHQISQFYLQILSTEASFYSYDRPLSDNCGR